MRRKHIIISYGFDIKIKYLLTRVLLEERKKKGQTINFTKTERMVVKKKRQYEFLCQL